MVDSTSNTGFRWARPVLMLVLIAVAVGAAAWFRQGQPHTDEPAADSPNDTPPDPRLTFATEFRNVHPDVKYVGDAACAVCHDAITKSYHQHPMGRSAEWVRAGATVDHAAGPHGTFDASGYRLSVIRKGDRVWHQTGLAEGDATAPSYEVAADLAIGSGSRGRSYVTFDRGAAWQSPISWFGQRDRWDVSPGFELEKEIRRPILPRCLGCHTNQPEPIPDSLNRYRDPPLVMQASIGCERCHGPGELHVRERERGDRPVPDTSIVNPARLSGDLKGDVCRQCHLQGAVQIARRGRDASEYRPGLPWEQFVSTFLRHPDVTDRLKSVGQFEQMDSSRCFTKSGGQMNCTSCHDPHAKPAPAAATEFFRGRCNSCHETHGCSLPLPKRAEKDDSCVACHMPRRESSNVVHVAITDHRIMRRPDAGAPRVKGLPAGQTPLIAYRRGPHAPSQAELDRDFAIAMGDECARTGAPAGLWRVIEERLDRTLDMWRSDSRGWLTRSRVHAKRGDSIRAMEAANSAVERNAESEVALIELAGAAFAAEDFVSTVRVAEKLIALNPSSADHRQTRAMAYFSQNNWAKAEADCREVLSIQPVRPNVRFMLAVCLHKRGDVSGGRRELDLALKLTLSPEMRTTLSKWYSQYTR